MADLSNAVRSIVEGHGEDKMSFVNDVLTHGCVSGIVGELIYHNQTHQWTDDHWDGIQDMIHEYEFQTGEAFYIPVGADWKNFLAWWSFESMVWEMYGEGVFQ